MTNTTTWNRKEYHQVLRALHTEAGPGVLLTGELGMGKSDLIRTVLASSQLTLPVIRLICSTALTTSAYGALAPLLTHVKDEINDVVAIREASKMIDAELVLSEGQKHVLIVVEDAQYIDSASAFVLGQLVRSGNVKLLVVSTEEHQDPLSLEALISVAQLSRIRLDALSVEEVHGFCESLLQGPVSTGSVRIIHRMTAGFYELVQGYVDLLRRQESLVQFSGCWVLTNLELHTDEHAIDEVRELVHRQHSDLRTLLVLLSLSGPLAQAELKALGLLETLQQHQSSLVFIRQGKAGILSSYLAQCIRQGVAPGRNLSLFHRFMNSLGEKLPQQADVARWLLALGEPLPAGLIRNAIPQAIATYQYSLALELLEYATNEPEHWVVEQRTKALLGAGLIRSATNLPVGKNPEETASLRLLQQNVDSILNWNLWIERPEAPFSGSETNSGTQKSTVVGLTDLASERWQDIQMMELIESARTAYDEGRITDAVNLSEAAVEHERLLAPDCHYRLSLLILRVRSLLAGGDPGAARQALEVFELDDEYEIMHSHGSLQLLRALVLVEQAHIREARSILETATAELRARDPENLLSLCLALNILLHPRPGGAFSGTLSELGSYKTADWDQQPSPPQTPGNWWAQDGLLLRMLRLLGESKVSHPAVAELLSNSQNLGIIARDRLNYLLWCESNDEKLRKQVVQFYTHNQAPTQCVVSNIHRHIVLLSEAQDISAMQDYALELYRAGHVVPALELSSRVVEHWDDAENPRHRGFAIRQIHEWLHEVNQEPWGLIARTLGSSGLTIREEEIVDLVRRGMSNKDIARSLTVSQRTVEGHLYRIFAKLGVTQRSELSFGD